MDRGYVILRFHVQTGCPCEKRIYGLNKVYFHWTYGSLAASFIMCKLRVSPRFGAPTNPTSRRCAKLRLCHHHSNRNWVLLALILCSPLNYSLLLLKGCLANLVLRLMSLRWFLSAPVAPNNQYRTIKSSFPGVALQKCGFSLTSRQKAYKF